VIEHLSLQYVNEPIHTFNGEDAVIRCDEDWTIGLLGEWLVGFDIEALEMIQMWAIDADSIQENFQLKILVD
jgi:hypothetical protein